MKEAVFIGLLYISPSLIQSNSYVSSPTFPVSKLHSHNSGKILALCILIAYLLIHFYLTSEKPIPSDLCVSLFFALELMEIVCSEKKKKKERKKKEKVRHSDGIFYQMLSRTEHWASYYIRSSS